MAHLQPLTEEETHDLEEVLGRVQEAMGFVPNSLRTMSRRPELVKAFVAFAGTLQGGAQVEPVLQQLVAHVASTAAGCSYCQAHTGAVAERRGAEAELVAQAWEFETSDAFDDRQRAALRLARDAALVPNAVTPQHFEELRRHFDEAQIVDLVAVISLFGFLNRWNDTLATHLEDEPKDFGERALESRGWAAGKHE
ncbi:MAG: carboxymuconolactone decarboxylase family protein [Acidobacteriota bacterium]